MISLIEETLQPLDQRVFPFVAGTSGGSAIKIKDLSGKDVFLMEGWSLQSKKQIRLNK
jgi:hypothetical protein